MFACPPNPVANDLMLFANTSPDFPAASAFAMGYSSSSEDAIFPAAQSPLPSSSSSSSSL